MIACLIYASVDGAGAPPFPLTKSTLRDAAITPVAAVARASTDPTGPLVIAGPEGIETRLAQVMEALFENSSKTKQKFDRRPRRRLLRRQVW